MEAAPGTTGSVLCQFWQEDGVWNAKARDLAVVVFGATFEDAKTALRDGLIGHLETIRDVGLLEETLRHLIED